MYHAMLNVRKLRFNIIMYLFRYIMRFLYNDRNNCGHKGQNSGNYERIIVSGYYLLYAVPTD